MSRRWRVLGLIVRVTVKMRAILNKVNKSREKMKLYCCRLFPNDYEFQRETLVQLWMAMGFSSQSCVEKFCERYFDLLLDEQYIIFSSIDIVTGRYLYKVNHEGNDSDSMGEKKTNKEDLYAVLEYEDANGSKSRHISLVSNCINETTFKKLQNFGGELRTLLFIHNYGSSLNKIPSDMFFILEFLRALDLSGSDILELPRSIGNVRQLRYLDLSFTLIESLPESIDQLHQLQTLKLQGCKHLHELPKGIKELICLRHLDLDVLGQLTFLPKGIGALTELCTLSAFLVDSEEGCTIHELKFLNKLKGSFCVSGLENVAHVDDVQEAALQDKKYVTQLQLRWSDRISYSNEDKQLGDNIIASLNLNRGLQDLQIVSYPGSDIPAWVDFREQRNLISITLLNCNNNDLSLRLGQLPNLKYLSIIHMNWVTKIKGWSHEGGDEAYVAFPKLEKLEIECMFTLETWIDKFKHGDFPFLSTLIIKQCPKLTRLPFLPHLQVLKHLEMSDCPEFTCLPDGALSTSLETLIIDDCPFLEKRCSKEGEDWHKVKRIPNIWIDLQNIGSNHEDGDFDDNSLTIEDICSIDEDVCQDINPSAEPGYPPSAAMNDPLAPGAPLKGKGLAKDLLPFPKFGISPDQLVKGQVEQEYDDDDDDDEDDEVVHGGGAAANPNVAVMDGHSPPHSSQTVQSPLQYAPQVQRTVTQVLFPPSDSSSSHHQAESFASKFFQLRFQGKLPETLFTYNNIEDAGAPITLEFCYDTGKRVADPELLYMSQMKVKIWVLHGDFDVKDIVDWTEVFQKHVVVPRKDKALLKGNCEYSMSSGAAIVCGFSFTDNSSALSRNKYLRLGAQVTRGLPCGWVVKPAVSEAFRVKERRLISDKKHATPSPTDELYRLINISKYGSIYPRALSCGVATVMDFLQLYHTDPGEMKEILKVPETKWEEIVKHAKACNLSSENYRFQYHDDESGDFLLLKCDFNIESVTFKGQTSQPYESLDIPHKEKVGILRKAAYKNRNKLRKVYDYPISH